MLFKTLLIKEILKMATEKAEAPAKKIATAKVAAVEKKAVKPVAKPADQEPVIAEPIEAKPEAIAEKPKKETKKRLKVKVVRDFFMPLAEYQLIADIKETCLKAGLRVKKSEVLRAGVKALSGMDEAQLKSAMAGMGKIKADSPKKIDDLP